jgi:hypothetical protein
MSTGFIISEKYINEKCGLHMKEHQMTLENGQLGINEKTTCAKHDHITKEKYLEIVPQIIDEFISRGFDAVLEQFHPIYDSDKIYSNLKKKTTDINSLTCHMCGNSNKIIKNAMYRHLYEVKNYKGTNLKSLWTTERLEKAFNISLKSTRTKPDIPQGQGETIYTNLFEIFKRLKFNPVTIYSPLMTKCILQELGCKTVFDPCIGWGGRMVGTCSIDGEYTGCEPYTKTYIGLKSIQKTLSLDNVTIYNNPVEELLGSHELINKQFDCCLTSPPYYDLEVYCDEDSQSIRKYTTYDDWLKGFIEPIIKYVTTHCTKFSCWSVKNFKTDQPYNLYDDIVSLHASYGWEYYTEYAVTKNTLTNNKASGDVTYVFKPL